MKKIFYSFFLLFVSMVTMAQQKQMLSGNVKGTDNIGIPGVSVVIEGTTTGTITDIDGNFSLETAQGDVVVFSFIGYETQKVAVGSQTTLNVILQESVELVNEVVVVGYGSQKVKDLTSSITTVKSEELTKTPAGQAMQALQGKVAGLQIVNTGSPGSEPTVRIRGIGSYPGIGSSNPLYVVDGMYFNSIDFLNPSDIETLSVLKDASAAAIYGVRAANGVVLITTKKGTKQKATITYEGYIGMQTPQNVLKMANSEQFVNYINQTGSDVDKSYINNAMQRYGRSRVNPNVPDVNTDWYDEIMKKSARQQNHSLSINGGSESSTYSMGVSYFEQQGLLETAKNSYERMNIRGKFDHQVNNWLKAGVNVNISNAQRYEADPAIWASAYYAVPTLPVYDEQNYEDNLAAGNTNASRYSSGQLLGYRGAQNPFLQLDYRNNRQDIRKLLAGIYTEISILPNKLKLKTSYNLTHRDQKNRDVGLPYYVTNDSQRDLSTINVSRGSEYNQFFDNVLTFTDSFGNHNLTAMVGTSYRDESYDVLTGYAEDVPLNEHSWYINQARSQDSKTVNDGGTIREYGLSYFGRVSYNYDSRYIAYFTLRREGTSKYQEKWGTFPAFGLGWVLSEENFFNGLDFIDYFKIRGGWGRLGNDGIPRQDGANTTNPVFLAMNDTQVNGTTTTSTFGYLRWEIVEGTNFGISANLLDNRLSVEADYFIRDTKNAAIPIRLQLQPGEITRNFGEIRNSGFELALNWNGKINKDLSYTVGFNMATLKNEVRDLYGQPYVNVPGPAEFRQRSAVGEPLASFYGYQVAGVYQNAAEIAADPVAVANNLVPGDFKYVDRDNNDVIDDNDRTYLGSYMPKLTYGGSLGVTYKNLEFSMNIMGQSGNKILNRKRGEIIWTNDANIDADLANNLWNGEGTSNSYPSASGLRRAWNQNFSNYLVEDGAFFRIQNMRLAYNLKGSSLLGKGMPDAKIFVTAERPFTSFNYNGFNPEIPNGIDAEFSPVPSVYTIGVNLKF